MELWRTAKYVLTLLEMSSLCNEYIIHNLEQIQGHIYIQAHTENSWRGHMKGRPRRRRDVLWLSPWLPSLCRHALRDFPKSARDNWVLNPQGIFFSSPLFCTFSTPSSPISSIILAFLLSQGPHLFGHFIALYTTERRVHKYVCENKIYCSLSSEMEKMVFFSLVIGGQVCVLFAAAWYFI